MGGKINFRFKRGQVVHHKIFKYSGLILGADPVFKGCDNFYKNISEVTLCQKILPRKNKPWYRIRVLGGTRMCWKHISLKTTYVPEDYLKLDTTLNN